MEKGHQKVRISKYDFGVVAQHKHNRVPNETGTNRGHQPRAPTADEMSALPNALATVATTGCSFLVTSGNLTRDQLRVANRFLVRRGPDHTSHIERFGVHFVHNLLWLTGKFTPQPFVDDAAGLVALFNGEIYNYRELGSALAADSWAKLQGEGSSSYSFTTDGEALLPMYRRFGETFPQRLRGEFSVVVADARRDLLILSTDVFGTKPFWRVHEGGGGGGGGGGGATWGVSSYASGLLKLGHKQRLVLEMAPNTIEVRRLSSFRLLRTHTLHSFELRQHKHDLADWSAAFHASMARRAATLQHGVFVGLSSGADSGLIALRLVEMGVPHHLFSLTASEVPGVLRARHAFARNASEHNVPHPIEALKEKHFEAAFGWVARHVEPYTYTQQRRRIALAHDPGASALSHICSLARPLGIRVYLSGAGADEIYGDYGRIGAAASSDGRVRAWPANLSAIWPWPSFFGQEMRDYLRKEEYVAGAHAIEGRFPFLDVDLVQEFLWLNTSLKGRATKYPIHAYIANAGYPTEKKKHGFWTADWEKWKRKMPKER